MMAMMDMSGAAGVMEIKAASGAAGASQGGVVGGLLMHAVQPLGYLAAVLVLAAFCMRDMKRLRWLAIASNEVFIAYAGLAGIVPVLLLHLLLLPVNVHRLLVERHAAAAYDKPVTSRGLLLPQPVVAPGPAQGRQPLRPHLVRQRGLRGWRVASGARRSRGRARSRFSGCLAAPS